MFLPQYGANGLLIQYAMRVLEHHDIGVTFFYTPQVVQALRTDNLGALCLLAICSLRSDVGVQATLSASSSRRPRSRSCSVIKLSGT
jgi:hypothetical protein